MDATTVLVLGSTVYIPVMGLLFLGVSFKLKALRAENNRRVRLSVKLLKRRGPL